MRQQRSIIDNEMDQKAKKHINSEIHGCKIQIDWYIVWIPFLEIVDTLKQMKSSAWTLEVSIHQIKGVK